MTSSLFIPSGLNPYPRLERVRKRFRRILWKALHPRRYSNEIHEMPQSLVERQENIEEDKNGQPPHSDYDYSMYGEM
jgi:hypothetical protein